MSFAYEPAVPIPTAALGFEHIQRHWDPHHSHWSAKILPGELYVTKESEAIATVLGSCIAACIRDPASGIGGMNHFMLPKDNSDGVDAWSQPDGTPSTRYGNYAMESLINAALVLGAQRARLEIKLFGGGRILPSMSDVGARNIEFARGYARIEGLPILSEDLGGDTPRHVIYFPKTGRVLLKRLRAVESNAIVDSEVRYQRALTFEQAHSDVELFE